MNSIPKIIHYCWFGGNPLPELAIKCINSWRIFFPDYEIVEWNENNFDVNIIPYTRDAYKAKKYAFVSDYARFWILYKYGGVYFDTDVEVIKDMRPIIEMGAFMGCENDLKEIQDVNNNLNACLSIGVAPGLGLAVQPMHKIYKELLDLYSKLSFINSNGSYNNKTVVEYTTELLIKHGLIETCKIQSIQGIFIYPKEYFCPLDYKTGELVITENCYSIHHYMGSWQKNKSRIFNKVSAVIGVKLAHKIAILLKNFHIIK